MGRLTGLKSLVPFIIFGSTAKRMKLPLLGNEYRVPGEKVMMGSRKASRFLSPILERLTPVRHREIELDSNLETRLAGRNLLVLIRESKWNNNFSSY